MSSRELLDHGRPPRQAEVAVLGAGAAGLAAAHAAAGAGASVTLLNAHPRPGLKILMSGGTRCNVTHREVTERDFEGGSRPFVARVLRAFPVPATLDWLQSLGVALKLEETGKYFPVSDDARTVLESLLAAVEGAGVRCLWGWRAIRLAASPAGWRVGLQPVRDANAFRPVESRFGVAEWPLPSETPSEWLEARTVVLATGGLSFPRTGSDGAGYALAASVGHTIVPPVPALTPFTSGDPLCSLMQGVTLEAELALRDGSRGARARGSFLFTHFGYSGPAALDLSRHWHRASSPERAVLASFLSGETPEAWLDTWKRRARSAEGVTVRSLFGERLPARLLERLCEEAGVRVSAPLAQVPRESRAALLDRAFRRPLHVTGTLGFEKAECTAGGVRLSEVDPSTLESRLAPGLFLCGEILDVEGHLGGYNFQWAWSTGTVAGKATAR